MIATFIILMCFPIVALSGRCQFNKNSFECSEINQDDFVYEMFKQRGLCQYNVINVTISNSNYEHIEVFPDLHKLVGLQVESLVIRNSSVKQIKDDAFSSLKALKVLDLNQNYLEETTFLDVIKNNLHKLNISNNNLQKVNLSNYIYIRYVDFSRNNISIIIPLDSFYSNSPMAIDLSYNKLTEINETKLNIRIDSLNIDYNIVNFVEFADSKYYISMKGNNIKSIKSNGVQIGSAILSFLPETKLTVTKSLMIQDTVLRTLKYTLNLNGYPRININFSNTFVSHISENYFQNLDINELDLSYNNLEYLNHSLFFKSSVLKLDLSHCQLRNITLDVFKNIEQNYYYLRTLNLSGNLLDDFPDFCQTLPHLTALDLSATKINQIKFNIFQKCRFLKILNVSNTLLTSVEFDKTPIEILDLSQNLLTHINHNNFSRLKELVTLNLNKNKITLINNHSFANLEKLRYLDLSHNFIDFIGEFAFTNLKNLISINLDDNQIPLLKSKTYLDMKKNVTGTDSISPLHPLSFSFLNISQNAFKQVHINNVFLDKISQPIQLDNSVEIETLSVQFNGIMIGKTVSNPFITYLHFIDSNIDLMKNYSLLGNFQLKELRFINSNISAIEPGILRGLFNLVVLNASPIFKNCKILYDNVFQDLQNLRMLNITNTQLSEIRTNAFYGLTKLNTLYLNKNQLQHINEEIFIFLKATLSVLDLSNNPLLSINLNLLSYFLPNLITLDISFCSLEFLEWHSQYLNISKLENLYLNDNFITHIQSTVFDTLINLKTLFLNNNQIKRIEADSFVFISLEKLRLDNNSLEQVHLQEIYGMDSLKSLNISNTNISDYSFYDPFIFALPYIESLDLDNSNWGTPSVHKCKDIGDRYPSLNRVNINHNFITCSVLSKLLICFDKLYINYLPYKPVLDTTNIMGIKCIP